MRLIIAGSRSVTNMEELDSALKYYNLNPETVVCGGARGADELGKEWAVTNVKSLDMYSADWNTHGKIAGFIRNREMAENADALLALWDGVSKGTAHMIETAKKLKLQVYMDGVKGNFLEIDITFKRIRIDNYWYLRRTKVDWYLECDTGYETLNYSESILMEHIYQCQKQS